MSFNIFISHAAEDAELAAILKAWIELAFQGTLTFVGSHQSDIPPGARWSAEIERSLREAHAMIVLVTKRSVGKAWVAFEVGACSILQRPIIPLCFDRIDISALGEHLGSYQAVTVDGVDAVSRLVDALCALTHTSYLGPPLGDVYAAMDDASLSCYWVSSSGKPWARVRFRNYYLAWEGPFEFLQQGRDEERCTKEHRDVLSAIGFECKMVLPSVVAGYGEEGYRLVIATDCRTWRRELIDERGQCHIMVRPRRGEGTPDDPIVVVGPSIIVLKPGPRTLERFGSDAMHRAIDRLVPLRQLETACERAGIAFYDRYLDDLHVVVNGRSSEPIVNVEGVGVILIKPGSPPTVNFGSGSPEEIIAQMEHEFGRRVTMTD